MKMIGKALIVLFVCHRWKEEERETTRSSLCAISFDVLFEGEYCLLEPVVHSQQRSAICCEPVSGWSVFSSLTRKRSNGRKRLNLVESILLLHCRLRFSLFVYGNVLLRSEVFLVTNHVTIYRFINLSETRQRSAQHRAPIDDVRWTTSPLPDWQTEKTVIPSDRTRSNGEKKK